MCAVTMFVAVLNFFNTGKLGNVIVGVTVDIFGSMAGVNNKNTIMGWLLETWEVVVCDRNEGGGRGWRVVHCHQFFL